MEAGIQAILVFILTSEEQTIKFANSIYCICFLKLSYSWNLTGNKYKLNVKYG